MMFESVWARKVSNFNDRQRFAKIYAMCFSPDGCHLIVAAEKILLIFNAQTGVLLGYREAHDDIIYTVSYCANRKYFASGSADTHIAIWTPNMRVVAMYQHRNPIRCIAFNPVTHCLVSCSSHDIALWPLDVRDSRKRHVVVSGIPGSCAWSHDGMYLAIGMTNGLVTVRDQTGRVLYNILRNDAVFALCFLKTDLIIADCTGMLSFHSGLTGVLLKEGSIGIKAFSISLLREAIVVAGMDRCVVLSHKGVFLTELADRLTWTCQSSPTGDALVIARENRRLEYLSVRSNIIYALYGDKCAYRENITDLVVVNLTTGLSATASFGDTVHYITIHENSIAVHVGNTLCVFALVDAAELRYQVSTCCPRYRESVRILLAATSVDVCERWVYTNTPQGTSLIWTMPALIRCTSVTSINSVEVILLGLENGQVHEVQLNRLSSRLLVETPWEVRHMDVSMNGTHLAVLHFNHICRVFEISTGHFLYEVDEVVSVAWNSECEELLCFRTLRNDLLIRAHNFIFSKQQLIEGTIVKFQGNQVFILKEDKLLQITVPLWDVISKYMRLKKFDLAYEVACLERQGLSRLDWEELAGAALDNLSFEIARKAYQCSENVNAIELIDNLQARLEAGEDRSTILREVYAYRDMEAAQHLRRAEASAQALEEYIDMEGNLTSEDLPNLLPDVHRSVAESALLNNDLQGAAKSFYAAGDLERAMELLTVSDNIDTLITSTANGPRVDREYTPREVIAEFLLRIGESTLATAFYEGSGDYKQVAKVLVTAQEWRLAIILVQLYPERRRYVYLIYALQMAKERKLLEMQQAFIVFGDVSIAYALFRPLIDNAISTERYSDAGYLCYLFSGFYYETATAAETQEERDTLMQEYECNERFARVYHAYDVVHQYASSSNSLLDPDAVLGAAKYAIALVKEHAVSGAYEFTIYLCLALLAEKLEAFKLSREMVDEMWNYIQPGGISYEAILFHNRFHETSESDSVNLASYCWRCRRHVPTLCALQCPYCRHALVHSMATHEVLPLVQFVPAEGITYEEALELVNNVYDPADTTTADTTTAEDPFTAEVDQEDDNATRVVTCSRSTLRQLDPDSVLVIWRGRLRETLWYRKMVQGLSHQFCPNCFSIFDPEDSKVQFVIEGRCSFCRHPATWLQTKKHDGRKLAAKIELPKESERGSKRWKGKGKGKKSTKKETETLDNPTPGCSRFAD